MRLLGIAIGCVVLGALISTGSFLILQNGTTPVIGHSVLTNPASKDDSNIDYFPGEGRGLVGLDDETPPMAVEDVMPSLCLREDGGLCSFTMSEKYYSLLSNEQKEKMNSPSVCMEEDGHGNCSFWINKAYLEEVGE